MSNNKRRCKMPILNVCCREFLVEFLGKKTIVSTSVIKEPFKEP